MATHEKGISLSLLSITLIIMSIVLILSLIKIYLSNTIYYESRHTNLIEVEVAALKEENSILKINVEQLKYKIKVTDAIFTLEEEQ